MQRDLPMTKSVTLGSLTIKQELKNGVSVFTFTGDVDESFAKDQVPKPESSKILFNLEKINSINSVGIREWINMIYDFSKLGTITYENCSVIFIDQINMVPELKAKGEVLSFFAPYFCNSHGEVNKLIDLKKIAMISTAAPQFHCEHCHKELEFDALEESYFLFLNSISKAS